MIYEISLDNVWPNNFGKNEIFRKQHVGQFKCLARWRRQQCVLWRRVATKIVIDTHATADLVIRKLVQLHLHQRENH